MCVSYRWQNWIAYFIIYRYSYWRKYLMLTIRLIIPHIFVVLCLKMNINGINCKMVTVKLDVTCDSVLLRQQLKPCITQLNFLVVKHIYLPNISFANAFAVDNIKQYGIRDDTCILFKDAVVYRIYKAWIVYSDTMCLTKSSYNTSVYINSIRYASYSGSGNVLYVYTKYNSTRITNNTIANIINTKYTDSVVDDYRVMINKGNAIAANDDVNKHITLFNNKSSVLALLSSTTNIEYIEFIGKQLGFYRAEFSSNTFILRDIVGTAVISVTPYSICLFYNEKRFKKMSCEQFALCFKRSKLNSLLKTDYIPQMTYAELDSIAQDLLCCMRPLVCSEYKDVDNYMSAVLQ